MLHPFRLGTAGHVVCAAQGSDAYLDSQVQVIIGTRLGERDMCMPFGVPDPTFATLTAADIQTCADTYGPDDLRIMSVDSSAVDDLTTTADVTWSRMTATR